MFCFDMMFSWYFFYTHIAMSLAPRQNCSLTVNIHTSINKIHLINWVLNVVKCVRRISILKHLNTIDVQMLCSYKPLYGKFLYLLKCYSRNNWIKYICRNCINFHGFIISINYNLLLIIQHCKNHLNMSFVETKMM